MTSLAQQVIDRCHDAMFTGIVRVHARQADGELWFLSGILEHVRFGVSTGDEAMTRVVAADSPRVELVPCLPNPKGGFKKGHPVEGALGSTRPVDILRFCETHALTCSLELSSGPSRGEVVYRLGELVSVRCDAGTDRAVAKMLEWNEGRFRFFLPTVELPTGATTGIEEEATHVPEEEESSGRESGAWRVASDEALKRRAEQAFAKREAEESVAPAKKDGLTAKERRKLKRKAEREADAQASTLVVHLQRVTTETLDVAVPVTDALLMSEPGAGAARSVDPEALLAEAKRLAVARGLPWKAEGEPVIQAVPGAPETPDPEAR